MKTQEELNAELAALVETAKKAETDFREAVKKVDASAVANIETKATLDAATENVAKAMQALRDHETESSKVVADLTVRVSEMEKAGKRAGAGGGESVEKSIGELFVEQLETANGGEELRVLKGRGKSTFYPAAMKIGLSRVRKANLVSSDATRMVQPMRDAILPLVQRPLRVRDLIASMPTTSNAVEYLELTGFGPETGTTVTIATATTTATVTHTAHGFVTFDLVKISGANEAELNGLFRITVTGANTYTYTITSISGAPGTGTITARNMWRHGAAAETTEGSAFPEGHSTWALRSTPVQNCGHWLPASRFVLEDLPQLRSLVDGELMYGCERRCDSQLIYGTGVAPLLQGIATHASAQTYTGASPDSYGDAVRRAATLVQIADLAADAVVLHPTDAERITLAKGSDGHYLRSNDVALPDLNVVVTRTIAQGNFLVGAFGGGIAAQLYDRQEVSVAFSEAHSDFFTKGLLAVRADMRLAIGWKRPEAFVYGSFGTATY